MNAAVWIRILALSAAAAALATAAELIRRAIREEACIGYDERWQ